MPEDEEILKFRNDLSIGDIVACGVGDTGVPGTLVGHGEDDIDIRDDDGDHMVALVDGFDGVDSPVFGDDGVVVGVDVM